MRRKYHILHRKKCPTGDPHCPPEVRLAKTVQREIGMKAHLGNGKQRFDLANGFPDDAPPEETQTQQTMLVFGQQTQTQTQGISQLTQQTQDVLTQQTQTQEIVNQQTLTVAEPDLRTNLPPVPVTATKDPAPAGVPVFQSLGERVFKTNNNSSDSKNSNNNNHNNNNTASVKYPSFNTNVYTPTYTPTTAKRAYNY